MSETVDEKESGPVLTLETDGSTLVDLLYYGVGGDGYTTKNIRIYIADFNATHPNGFNSLSGDQRYGLEAYMTVPPNAFQPGSTQEEQSSHAFNAYNFSALPLPRAHVTSAFAATLSLLETYTAPDDGGLDRENRVAVPINIVPSS